MAADTRHDALVADLVALGRDLPRRRCRPTAGRRRAGPARRRPRRRRAERRRPAAPARASRHGRRRRRTGGGRWPRCCCRLLAAPPVRAAVADWFGFAGVIVRAGRRARSARRAPPPPTAGPGITLDQAARLVGFTPVVPAALGTPDGVEVSADRRVLSMTWSRGGDGTVRLDQFDGQLDYTVRQDAHPASSSSTVAGDFALWFDEPHEVVAPEPRRQPPHRDRAAGRAHPDLGCTAARRMRLEGDLSQRRALEIAESVPPAR